MNKRILPVKLLSICIALSLAVSLTGQVAAAQQGSPLQQDDGGGNGDLEVGVEGAGARIIVYLSANTVQGTGWQVGEEVFVYINDPDTGPGWDYSSSAVPNGSGLVYFNDIPFDLEPGMYVTMISGPTTRGHTIFDLRITYVSESLEEVGGHTSPVTPTVYVTASTDGVTSAKTVSVTRAGNWLANFKNEVDINPRTYFIVAQFDAQDNVTQVNWWINPPPVHDDIYQPINIPSVPWSHSANTTSASYEVDWEPEFSACGQAEGNASVWYKFLPAATGELTIDTFGSNYNTMLGVWAGFPGSSGVPILCNDNAGGTQQSKVTLAYTAGVYYYIGVAQKGFPQMGGQLKFHVTSFADVAGSHPLWRFVEGFYDKGITTGCAVNPLRYCPDRGVTRAEMAVFILRAMNVGVPGYTPVDIDPDIFADVPVAGKEWMEPWIEQFYALEITTGCASGPLRYCPERGVTRAEMAVFLLRADKGKYYVPADVNPDPFIDVPVDGKEWMEPWIEQFYAEGYTTGCGGSIEGVDLRYCPERGVNRAEMAAFVDRAFDFPPLP